MQLSTNSMGSAKRNSNCNEPLLVREHRRHRLGSGELKATLCTVLTDSQPIARFRTPPSALRPASGTAFYSGKDNNRDPLPDLHLIKRESLAFKDFLTAIVVLIAQNVMPRQAHHQGFGNNRPELGEEFTRELLCGRVNQPAAKLAQHRRSESRPRSAGSFPVSVTASS